MHKQEMNIIRKVALITGAAEGFGRAFAEELLKKQIKFVGLLDIQRQKGEETCKQLGDKYGSDKVHFIQCDVTDKQNLEDAFNEIKTRFGKLDLVCNNAGIGNETKWERMIEINMIALIRGTHLAIHHMSNENGGEGGVIINIASIAGLVPLNSSPVYAATKHAVVGLTRSLAGHNLIQADNIRINALCPTFCDTAILHKTRSEQYRVTKEQTDQIMGTVKLIPVAVVVEAFMRLVEEDHNGQVMRITHPNGIDLQEYEEVKL